MDEASIWPIVGGIVAILTLWWTVSAASRSGINSKVEKSEGRIRRQLDEESVRDEKHQTTVMSLLTSLDTRLRYLEQSETLHRHTGYTYAVAQHAALMRWSANMQKHDPQWPGYSGPDPNGFEDGMKGRAQ